MLATSSRATLTGLAAAVLSLVLTVSLSMAEPRGIATTPSTVPELPVPFELPRDVSPNCPASVIADSTQQERGVARQRRRHRERRRRAPRLLENLCADDLDGSGYVR
jgi:hypothetical protein